MAQDEVWWTASPEATSRHPSSESWLQKSAASLAFHVPTSFRVEVSFRFRIEGLKFRILGFGVYGVYFGPTVPM